MAASDSYDYVIVGGGTAGCVLASRLQQKDPTLSILIIEAGSDVSSHPLVPDGINYARLLGSEIDWHFRTVPQVHLGGRVLTNHAGKALGGSTAINAGGWLRGFKEDYDLWADMVGDSRWSYEGLLPYFRKIESHFDPNGDRSIHGFDGPVKTESATSSGRNFPLRQPLQAAWGAIGVSFNPDLNSGNPLGLAEMVENRVRGKRQMSSSVYPLNVHILTETRVHRVIVDEHGGKKVATAVEIAHSNHRKIAARQEVLICAGAYCTPQLLMLSGIGGADELKRHGIELTHELPDVGRHLQDHTGVRQWWRLKHPERGLAMGSPAFNDPAFSSGIPLDFAVTLPVAKQGLRQALLRDDPNHNPDNHPLISVQRGHFETFTVYMAINPRNPAIPLDGTHIMTMVNCMLPTSRGTVTLADGDPQSDPVIDPNYFATQTDRHVLREGLRKLREALRDTVAGQEIVEEEAVEDGARPLSVDTSDDEMDDLIKRRLQTLYHPAGSASMGKVVDTDLRVKGIDRLRVVDASVIPTPLATHIQMCIYALAEHAADIILQGH